MLTLSRYVTGGEKYVLQYEYPNSLHITEYVVYENVFFEVDLIVN